ncbi:MAG: hypothetical protein ACREUQ_14700, partial [Burkholderiales bacterium]
MLEKISGGLMRARIGRLGAIAMLASAVVAVSATIEEIPEAALSAGSFTIAVFDERAFSEPAPGLSYKQNEKFLRGRHHFNQKWVVFPSLGGDW